METFVSRWRTEQPLFARYRGVVAAYEERLRAVGATRALRRETEARELELDAQGFSSESQAAARQDTRSA